jgi:hypothetical protein
MGTSFIEYKEFGFWSRDNFIESWVTTLLAEMQNSPTLEKWQKSLIDDWRIQATTASGWFLGLDKYLIDTQRKDSMLSLANEFWFFPIRWAEKLVSCSSSCSRGDWKPMSQARLTTFIGPRSIE